MRRARIRLAVALVVAVVVAVAVGRPAAWQQPAPHATFAARVAQLSEPGGYFPTDDLLSNERSYLHVIPDLQKAGIEGGVYIGVGPDTSFSYIARTKPSMAFIIDIRRDNLLLHVLFKALFAASRTRVDFASRLFGRTPPAAIDEWRTATVDRIVQYLDSAHPIAPAARDRDALETIMRGFGVPLSASDLTTIDRFHQTFVAGGLDMKLEVAGSGTRDYYPTYRDLLLETDRAGHRWNYLASEDDFQFVKRLEDQDLVIPVVGDLAGPTAVRRIGDLMTKTGTRLGAYYTSNVEYYLFRDGSFQGFLDNLAHLPHGSQSVIIRSAFVSAVRGYVPMLPGYASASMIGGVDDLLHGVASGRIRSYLDLVAPGGGSPR